jgi:hypothetical protein
MVAFKKGVCALSSVSTPQILHFLVTFMPQQSLLALVASALDVAFQAKILTLGGTEYFQMLYGDCEDVILL